MAANRITTLLNAIRVSPNFRRTRCNGGARSLYNPLIVLRDRGLHNRYELHYVDESGTILQPLPESVSEVLLSSGIERFLDDQSDVASNDDLGPASEKVIESMPVVKIVEDHVNRESHCGICKERFELDCEARELPCKHIYHSECILPWLHKQCSCPICRFELARDEDDSGKEGMVIWRLPRGVFAVGEINVNGGEEIELPRVYTELDEYARIVGEID